MNSIIIDFPSKVSLIVYKKPCNNLKIATVNGNRGLSWNYGEKRKLTGKEIQDLLDDTIKLINNTGLFYFNYFIKAKVTPEFSKEKDEKFHESIEIIKEYFTKWGPIINTRENSISLIDIQMSMYSVFMCLSLWENQYGFMKQLYSLLNPDDNRVMIKTGEVKYWYAAPHTNEHDKDYVIYFAPEYEFKEFNYSTFGLRFKQLNSKEFNRLCSTEEDFVKHIKSQILNNISAYMQQQGVKVTNIKLNVNTFAFDLAINNRLLAFILYSLPEFVNTSVKSCACGCGGLMAGNSKYLPGHSKKIREKNSDRKIKAWIRTKKNRGLISQDLYEKLCRKVDSLILEKNGDKEIRSIIQNIIENGGINNANR